MQPYEWHGFRDPNTRRRRWEEDGYLGHPPFILAIDVADGEFAGIVQWRPFEGSGPIGSYEIGCLLWPQYRGRGIGTIAQRMVTDYVFQTTLANRVEAFTDAENLPEQRSLEKIGFTRDGVLRGAEYVGGSWRDVVVYSLLRDDPRP